ncbi:MAG: response regulator [Bacteroidetes bacterium]|nr:response regulator [Bacteroidota bacterium]
MSFAGNLRGWGITEMLQLIRNGKKTGALVVSTSSGNITIYFKAGMAVAVDTGVGEVVGSIMLQEGYITVADLDEAIQLQKTQYRGKRIEQILIALKKIEMPALAKTIRKQIESTVTDLIQLKGGSVNFEVDALPKYNALSTGVDVQGMLLGAAVVGDEMSVIRENIANSSVIPKKTKKGEDQQEEISLKLKEWKIYLAIDGIKDIKALSTKLKLDEFSVMKIVNFFVTEKWVEILKVEDKRKKILVVDDSLTIQKMIELALADSGFNLITATTGDAAIKAATESIPDLILLDVMLPDITGYKVCRSLRDMGDAYKRVPILMLSGKDAEIDKNLGKYAGADAYMTKPFEASDLLSKVKEHLGLGS